MKPFDQGEAIVKGKQVVLRNGSLATVAAKNDTAGVYSYFVGWNEKNACSWTIDGTHVNESFDIIGMAPTKKSVIVALVRNGQGSIIPVVFGEHAKINVGDSIATAGAFGNVVSVAKMEYEE